MSLSEEQIKRLLNWFINSSVTRTNWAEKRRQEHEKNHKWIQPEVLKKMSDEALEKNFLEYYRNGGGRQNLNQIYRDRIIRDKNKFRATLIYLLDEKKDFKERIDNVLEGEYHIEGFGKAILTSFLMDFNIDKYCLWNNKTEMGFSVLGWKVYENRDLWGVAYSKVLDALKSILDFKPETRLTFEDVDLFLHTISAESEGIEAVKAIKEGIETELPEVEEIQTQSTVQSMEFAMEKYLEEFIEANFIKINFGAQLELYQDEESNGRQYPTPIGNIDLLTVDKGNKDFVVIELKKGRSSDNVIGQILRYMGWVKENLAKDSNVRGIIIAQDKDERLQYALKLMPNVNLFTYSVSFD